MKYFFFGSKILLRIIKDKYQASISKIASLYNFLSRFNFVSGCCNVWNWCVVDERHWQRGPNVNPVHFGHPIVGGIPCKVRIKTCTAVKLAWKRRRSDAGLSDTNYWFVRHVTWMGVEQRVLSGCLSSQDNRWRWRWRWAITGYKSTALDMYITQ